MNKKEKLYQMVLDVVASDIYWQKSKAMELSRFMDCNRYNKDLWEYLREITSDIEKYDKETYAMIWAVV